MPENCEEKKKKKEEEEANKVAKAQHDNGT